MSGKYSTWISHQQCTTNCQHSLQQSERKGGQGDGHWGQYGRKSLSMFPTKTIVIAEHSEGSEAGCEFIINEKEELLLRLGLILLLESDLT